MLKKIKNSVPNYFFVYRKTKISHFCLAIMIQNHKKIKKTKTQETDSNSLEEEYTNKLSKKLKKCDKNREEPKITIITDTKLKFSLKKNNTTSNQLSDNDDMDLIADDSSTTTKSEIFYDDQDKNITYRIGGELFFSIFNFSFKLHFFLH